ncbi:MAG: WbqC family protein [Candidatus Eremiobacteraeota bacterium]|nr:WbqC family protein [Candidatus Eremiobacteraeota bacterium]
MNCDASDERSHVVGIIQSNYIPWKGYFDFIASVDEFVLLDEVQYTRRDWRNRNRIKTQNGLQWLTIPVDVKGKYLQRIDETRIADEGWIDSHLAAIRHAYGRAASFRSVWPWLEDVYGSLRGKLLLSDINEVLIRAMCERLRIHTPIRRSTDFPSTNGKNERLIQICRELGATTYVSGPAARGYLDESQWAESGIRVRFKTYDGYAEYEQLYPPFENGVSIVDVLLHTGDDAPAFIRQLQEHR